METIYAELHEKLEEEIEDAHEYLDLAEKAEARGCEYLATGLRNIARDEFTHAYFHRDYLIAKGKYDYGEAEEKWHHLKKIFNGR